MYQATGENSMFQYCDKGGFGMGGGVMDGRFGLFIESDFWRGSSIRTECFENEILSGQETFNIIDMEVWGFE